MRAILDTNLLVAEALSHRGYEAAVSSLSWAELGYGVRKVVDPIERARRESRIARLRAVLGAGVPFDDAAADAYETVCGLVLAGGREVRGRAIDLMIAATAAAHGAAVITRNVDDFAGLEGFVAVVAA
ncbi:MAG: PIN domain-containing protein [Bifidobacteriaceae bacterium]|jgi:predicted nucleic acid-binding protein|nr:PIN domain-containing protein [Bifidobacteriaceae bacterium]